MLYETLNSRSCSGGDDCYNICLKELPESLIVQSHNISWHKIRYARYLDCQYDTYEKTEWGIQENGAIRFPNQKHIYQYCIFPEDNDNMDICKCPDPCVRLCKAANEKTVMIKNYTFNWIAEICQFASVNVSNYTISQVNSLFMSCPK